MRLFVSYAREDGHLVDHLVRKLEPDHSAWLDREAIHGGEEWRVEVANAIADADAFLIVLSRSSVTSREVRKELSWASEKAKHILPFRVTSVEIPAEMAYELSGLQQIDGSSNLDGGIRQLAAALAKLDRIEGALFRDASTGRKLNRDHEALAEFLGLEPNVPPQIHIAVGRRELTHLPLKSDIPVPYEVDVVAEADVQAAFEVSKMLAPLYTSSDESVRTATARRSTFEWRGST